MASDGEPIIMQSPREEKRTYKILFAGDASCGKTRVIQTYLQKSVIKATTHDTICTCYEYELDGADKTLFLVDVRGTSDIAKASTCFDFPDVAIFFYAINDHKSLENLQYHWLPRFRMCVGFETPTILVGNKKDLRASAGLKLIASKQPNCLSFFKGMKVKTSSVIDMFLECSAEDDESISCVFQAVYSYIL